MDELIQKLPTVIRENLLATTLGIVGLVLLLYGLISYVGVDKKEEPLTFTAEDDKVDQETTSSEKQLVIDVAGAVNRPGVYKIKDGSRFQDAIVAAGGMSGEADAMIIAKQINLAAKLVDGAKVYIPFAGEVMGSSTGTTSTTGLLNINTASSKELDSLPGIGAVTSEKIINARPYAAVDDLFKKKIVSQKVFDQVKEKVSVY